MTEVPNPILSIGEWDTNGDLIADVAALGYIPDPVLDLTYGEGVFWSKYKPASLTTNDLYKPADLSMDWGKRWYKPPEGVEPFSYRTVVFDPPYKLNGTPTDSARYGVDKPATVKDRMNSILVGVSNASQLVQVGGYLLVKCQNQVANGRMYWQTDQVGRCLNGCEWSKEAMFHFLHTPRPQRSQVRARNNYSTLMVFKKKRRALREDRLVNPWNYEHNVA